MTKYFENPWKKFIYSLTVENWKNTPLKTTEKLIKSCPTKNYIHRNFSVKRSKILKREKYN